MKTKIILFLFLTISAALTAAVTEHSYNFGNPMVAQTGDFQTISFGNAMLTGRTGQPALPYQAVRLLLPPGEEAVRVTYFFEDEVILQGSFRIYPQQASRPVSQGPSGGFTIDGDVYSSHATFPEQAWGESSTHFLNGHSFLLATFTPVRYIPATGRVSWYQTVRVEVETQPTDRAAQALENLAGSASAGTLPLKLAQNQAMAASYAHKPFRDGDYQVLIVAPQSFVPSFEPLIDLYRVRGLEAMTATTETIGSSMSGNDLQEKIRNFIIQEFQQHGVEYVLLGGDAEHVPPRGFYCYVQSGWGYEDYNIPSDLYYSALDGNWNTDGDGMWGELGEDDLLPDVAVARFPASTVEQLGKIIHKTIRYQDEPVTGELRNIILAGEELYQDPMTFGEDYLELLIGEHADNGYTTIGIPENYTFNKMYDHLSYWGSSDLIAAINQGSAFIHHSGHANQTYVMRLDIYQVNNANFPQVNGDDHNYSLVYTHGCLCGAFDENDCIGEAMVLIDNFAVAGAFNSRYGWFNEGQTEGPSAHLHREFVDALYHEKESRIGMAHMISKIETSAWVNAPGQWEEGALRWCFYDCNIFGDPALGIWTDEPVEIETSYPATILPGTSSITVTVTSGGQAIEGLNCVIMAGDEMMGCCPTNASGQATIVLSGNISNFEELDLVVSGYNCLPHHYLMDVIVGTEEFKPEKSGITANPNPFREKTNVSFTLDTPGAAQFELLSASGSVLWTKTSTAHAGKNEIIIDGTNLPAGVLILGIKAEKANKFIRLIRLPE